MNFYLVIKWLHVVSSVILVGAGFGSAFHLFFVNRSGSVEAQAVMTRLVVRADAWLTTPAVVFQPLSGLAMARLAGWPITTPWLLTSIALDLFAGACWLPVVWLQLDMARMARRACEAKEALPERYGRFARIWEALGCPAFIAMLAAFYLMVAKPGLWG